MSKRPPAVVHVGDCIQYMKTLPKRSVPLIVTDPPYNIGYEYDGYDDKRSPQEYLAWCSAWLLRATELLTDNGSMWIVINDAYVSEIDVTVKKLGLTKRSHVIWHYTFGQHIKTKLTPSHAHLLYYVKSEKDFTFNPPKVPSARQMLYNDKRAAVDGRNPDDTWILRPQWCQEGFYDSMDTWHVPRTNGTFKERAGTPNQLPERLVGRIISMCSNPEDMVFDPFAGSGTVLAVAKKLGRNYLGAELSTKYALVAVDRILAAAVGQELSGPVPQGS